MTWQTSRSTESFNERVRGLVHAAAVSLGGWGGSGFTLCSESEF